jgi:hypothetical protein
MNQATTPIEQDDAVLALAGGLLHDPASGRQRVKTCLGAIPHVFARRFIDVPPCGLVVPMDHAAQAAAALPLVERQLAPLNGGAPAVAMFRLPPEQEGLQRFLQCVPARTDPGGIAAQLRGLDLDAYWRESPVWRFEEHRAAVIGCDVRVSLRALSVRLGLPDLLAPANKAPVAAALAQALLRSFLHPQITGHNKLFVRVPSVLLTSPETWRVLEALPASALSTLVMVLGPSLPDEIDLRGLVARLRDVGVAACLAGIDWSVGRAVQAPEGVAWVRGPVGGGMDILRVEAAVAGAGPVRAIAEIGADPVSLRIALAAGFCYATGTGVAAAAHDGRRVQPAGWHGLRNGEKPSAWARARSNAPPFSS